MDLNSVKYSHTKGIYLENTFQFEADATILDSGEKEGRSYVILDQTIFHPQGGGQPSDLGLITDRESDAFVEVIDVRNIQGIIYHFVKELNPNLVEGKAVHLRIDMSRRILNGALHTGGHLIANLVERKYPNLKASKGYHFPDGPYVEFSVSTQMSDSEKAALLETINKDLAEAISRNVPLLVTMSSELLHQSEVGGRAEKPFRTVQIGDFPATPCGGTHLDRLGRFESIAITKVKQSKGALKVSYNVITAP